MARVGDADDGGVDIAAALAARERKDKEKAAAAAAMLPIDDDLSTTTPALRNQPRYTVPGVPEGPVGFLFACIEAPSLIFVVFIVAFCPGQRARHMGGKSSTRRCHVAIDFGPSAHQNRATGCHEFIPPNAHARISRYQKQRRAQIAQ